MWWKDLRIDRTFQTTIQYRHENSKMSGLQCPSADSNRLFHSEILNQQLIRYKLWSGNYKGFCKYCKIVRKTSVSNYKMSRYDMSVRLSLRCLLPNYMGFSLWMNIYENLAYLARNYHLIDRSRSQSFQWSVYCYLCN